MPHEVHEVAAVGFDRVVREQHVADPGHEGRGRARGVAVGGRERLGQEGFDLLGRRGVAFEEVAPLGQERDAAGWRHFGIRRREGRHCGLVEDFVTHNRITP